MAARHRGEMDHGWAWVVLTGTCFMVAVSDGFRNCAGIFYSEFIDTMDLSRAQAASVVGFLSAMWLLPGPIAASVAQKIGIRKTIIIGGILSASGLIGAAFVRSYWALAITFGGLTGTGFCVSFIPAVAGMNTWFLKYRQLALSLSMSSGAIGIFSLAPALTLMVNKYTWKGAALITAAIVFNCALTCGMTFFPVTPKPSGPTRPATDRSSDYKVLLTNPAFLIHLLNSFFMFGISLFLIFIVRHLTHHRDFTQEEGAAMVSICGFTSLFGRGVFIVLTFFPQYNTKNVRFYLFNGASLFGGIACAAVPFFWSFWPIALICGIMGIMQGLKIATLLNVTMDITTPARFQTGYGYFSFASGVSVISVPPLAGFLAETFHSYDPVFYLSGASLAFTFLLGSLSQYFDKKQSRKLTALSIGKVSDSRT